MVQRKINTSSRNVETKSGEEERKICILNKCKWDNSPITRFGRNLLYFKIKIYYVCVLK
jgi:hypothetical protein